MTPLLIKFKFVTHDHDHDDVTKLTLETIHPKFTASHMYMYIYNLPQY